MGSFAKERRRTLYKKPRAEERCRALETSNRALLAANADLEAFNYTVAHEIRMRLGTISLYGQVIQRRVEGEADQAIHGYLGTMLGQIDDITGLIGCLLDFSGSSHKELRKEPADLSRMAREVASHFACDDPVEDAGFRIAEGLTATGDLCLLHVVLKNLLGNAWKFTRRTAQPVIEFGAALQGGKTRYFVRDNGVGFDASRTREMFRVFTRLHCKEQFDGHGIGLATVQGIIRRHGGEIWAEGDVGKGATFYFTLG